MGINLLPEAESKWVLTFWRSKGLNVIGQVKSNAIGAFLHAVV